MKITIKNLSLLNFKGLRNKSIDFKEQTNISGDNATGKTTIMDAFIWLLFGKDSTDRKDFEIKTLDANNNAISKIDHEVTGQLIIDERPITLKRVLKEKWVKKRGLEESEFTGNETLFYCDDVPMQANEYKAKIDSLIDELIFKMVTNPRYFNEMKWQDRRNVLIKLAGEINDTEIINLKPDFKKLMDFLSGKSFDEFKRELSVKKKKIKDDLGLIPARIDEVTRSIPEEKDYTALEKELKGIETTIFELEGMISDISKKNEKVQEGRIKIQNDCYALKEKKQQAEFAANTAIQEENNKSTLGVNELKRKVETLQSEYDNNDSRVLQNQNTIRSTELKTTALREQWEEENKKVLIFNDNEFNCSACKRPFETDDIEAKKTELTTNFNNDKVRMLSEITNAGKALTKTMDELKATNLNIELKQKEIKKEIEISTKQISDSTLKDVKQVTSESFLSKSVEYQDLLSQIKMLEEKLSQPNKDDSDDKLQVDKKDLNLKADAIKTQLAQKETIEKSKLRITELEGEMKSLSQQLASLEKTEFVIDDFTRTKMDMVEKRVNSMFKLARFKMFNILINGGIEDACITLVNGVPYPDLNNAMKINVGRDIVNTLSTFYNISAPIFSDNAESINELLPVNSQDIRLIVTKDKQLIIT